jgi:hypothetical protein
MTMRADRDRYYFAAEDLFARHPDLVKTLLDEAPPLVPQLLDGLLWRSRLTVNGLRRVNYYIKYLLIDPDGKFHNTIQWVVQAKDPKLVVHPVLSVLSDIVWTRVACRSFLTRKSWFMTTLVIFVICQAVVANIEANNISRICVLGGRCFIYLFSMCVMLFNHIVMTIKSFRDKDVIKLFGRVPVPKYLENWQDSANLVLLVCLVIMLAFEPILRCLGADDNDTLFTQKCDASVSIRFWPYSVFSMFAMVLYYVLVVDLAVFSNRVSAYVLVCGRMLSEVRLCLLGLAGVLLTFSSALSCLDQSLSDFHGIHKSAQALWDMVMGIYSSTHYYSLRDEPLVLVTVFFFLVTTLIFLVNLLIAQLSCAYADIYADMVGYARMKRNKIIVESMPGVSPKRWNKFTIFLALGQRIEFNEGDVGVVGGIQTTEAAGANPTTVDSIKRFGGSTSPLIQWPDDDNAADDDSDRFERLETLIKKSMERLIERAGQKKKKGVGASSSGLSGSGGAGASGSVAGDEEGGEDGVEENTGVVDESAE